MLDDSSKNNIFLLHNACIMKVTIEISIYSLYLKCKCPIRYESSVFIFNIIK